MWASGRTRRTWPNLIIIFFLNFLEKLISKKTEKEVVSVYLKFLCAPYINDSFALWAWAWLACVGTWHCWRNLVLPYCWSYCLVCTLWVPEMAAKKVCEALTFSKSLIEEVQRWGCMKQTGVSLRYMMEFGSDPSDKNLLISAQFLHKELPIRIARRALELQTLPYGLSQKPAVLKVIPFSFASFWKLNIWVFFQFCVCDSTLWLFV